MANMRISVFTKVLTTAAVIAALSGAYGRLPTASAVVAAQGAAKAATVADSIFNAEQAKRGQTKYSQACSTCHQADLSGSDQAPALVGGDFLDRWDGQSVADLADRIRTSMPADDVGSLTTPMSVDIVSYILQANGFPAGSEEMKADRTALKTVMIKKK
jgi:mono/diheme cytochrome c family protein